MKNSVTSTGAGFLPSTVVKVKLKAIVDYLN